MRYVTAIVKGKFKYWTRLIKFHVVLKPFEKTGIYLFLPVVGRILKQTGFLV